jgi:hypothetical protein
MNDRKTHHTDLLHNRFATDLAFANIFTAYHLPRILDDKENAKNQTERRNYG